MNKNKEQRKLLKPESYILRYIAKARNAQGQKLIHAAFHTSMSLFILKFID